MTVLNTDGSSEVAERIPEEGVGARRSREGRRRALVLRLCCASGKRARGAKGDPATKARGREVTAELDHCNDAHRGIEAALSSASAAQPCIPSAIWDGQDR